MFSTLSMACLRSIAHWPLPNASNRSCSLWRWMLPPLGGGGGAFAHQHEQLPTSLTSNWVTLTRLLHGQSQAISESSTQELRYVLHHWRASVEHQRQLHGVQTMRLVRNASCTISTSGADSCSTSPLKSEPATLSVSDRSDSNPGRTNGYRPAIAQTLKHHPATCDQLHSQKTPTTSAT